MKMLTATLKRLFLSFHHIGISKMSAFSAGALTTKVMTALMLLSLASCGGDDYQDDFDRDFSLEGIGLDGPLSNANVAVYALKDSTGRRVVYSIDTPGTALATATTNQYAQIQNLLLNDGVNPPYVLEFTSTSSTLDITTGEAPVITTLRTLLTEDMLDAGDPLYATPLTTLTVNIALSLADDSDGQITVAEFDSALAAATSQVKSTLGLGINFDFFTTPPVLDSTVASNDSAALQRVALYRSAIETTRILVQQVSELVDATGDTVLTVLGSDLADGTIDGQVAGSRASIYDSTDQKDEALALLAQSPSSLCLVENSEGGCARTVAEVNSQLVDERADIGLSTSTSVEVSAPDLDPPRLSSDSDGDGVNNDQDAFPDNINETADTDGDGVGNNGDNCPSVSNANQLDTDVDGVGDACDTDSAPDTDADDDGVNNASDNCPSVANADQLDTDTDNQGNACDTDDDNDGISDTQETTNGTNPLLRDTDSDGDLDNADNCPLVSNADQLNSDDDTLGNVCDTDDDNDGVLDTNDAFPTNAGETADTDTDGVGNNGDNCPSAANADQLNTDGANDGGNACDLDDDNDGIADTTDNCDLVVNEDQADIDDDSQGNACDVDDDGDGLTDAQEVTIGTDFNDPDTDDDGVNDGTDNCPLVVNDDQADADDDDVGDACDDDADNDGLTDTQEGELGTDPLDPDSDNDTVEDGTDNCPMAVNTNQLNTDSASDGGNECDDDDDNDEVADGDDAFPLNPNESADTDGDTVGDNTDNCPSAANTNQANNDNDAFNPELDTTGGDECDTDDDNDGVSDAEELDNSDGIVSLPLDPDSDNDLIGDKDDNCPMIANPDQLNFDLELEEGVVAIWGDACDDDIDGDGILNDDDPDDFHRD